MIVGFLFPQQLCFLTLLISSLIPSHYPVWLNQSWQPMRVSLLVFVNCAPYNSFHFINDILVVNTSHYTRFGAQMKRVPPGSIDVKLEFQRAMIILYKRIETVDDLLRYWHFAGPCTYPHPLIEDIS